MSTAIYEQLYNACDCNRDDFDEADVNELISLISMATCWTQRPCETFLMGLRQEIIDLPDCKEDCGIISFEPFYHPFDDNSFTFKLIKIDGIEEEEIPITDYSYGKATGVFRIDPPIPSCTCYDYICGCRPEYKLVIEYFAGYEELPDCLLPLFCEAIKYIAEKNTCDCGECEICQTNMAIEDLRMSEDGLTIRDRLNYYFVKILYEQYKKQLGLISLCDRAEELWGMVI